jgi:hypothetical protein
VTEADKYFALEELILKEMDGTTTEGERAELNRLLGSDADARAYYLEFIVLCGELLLSGQTAVATDFLCRPQDIEKSALWRALAENERTAEAIPAEKTKPVFPISYRNTDFIDRKPHRVSKLAFYTAVISTAALLLMIAYVITHPRTLADPVATVTGQNRAVWAESAVDISNKNRLCAHSTLNLLEGFAEITFDNQARIIVQSPSKFDIEDYNQIFLHSGKLTVRVPPTAIGFVVRTTGASIVDYGTEFGVTADSSGQTETHVFEGQVELRAGTDPVRFAEAQKLISGQGGQVDKDGKLTVDSLSQRTYYVRRLPTVEHFGQPGKRIDLADIMGGGNGFGTGRQRVAIDPTSGQINEDFRMFNRKPNSVRYCPVPAIPCVDGVFIPLGGSVPQIVTSQGHTFSQCPETAGTYWLNLTNYPVASFMGNDQKQPEDIHLVRLGGVQYGTPMLPAIMMHSNLGVTFDLDAIRATVPGTRILRFTSSAGFSETIDRENVAADLWVLLDGENCRTAHLIQDQMHSAVYFNVDIQDHHRFLTLMTTDGGDGNGGDWTFFASPALELETIH